MTTNHKKIGLIPYSLILIGAIVIGRFVPIYAGGVAFILLHIFLAINCFKEPVNLTIWMLFSLSAVFPFLIACLNNFQPVFHLAIGVGLNVGLMPVIDGYYIYYGGLSLGFLSLGLIYQRTSFYHVGFGKGGGGFFILAALSFIIAVLSFHAALKLII